MRMRLLMLCLLTFMPLVSCSGNSGGGTILVVVPFTFAVMSDNHVYPGGNGGIDSPAITADIVNDIISQKASIVFAAGDEVDGQSGSSIDLAAQLAYYKTLVSTPLSNAGIAFYPLPGNHEYKNGSENDWSNTLPTWNAAFPSLPQNGPTGEVGGTYYVAYKNSLFILLDEYATGFKTDTRVNQGWLDSVIAGMTSQHLFVFGHAPAFQIDTYTDNTLRQNPSLRDAFWSSLENAKADIYFCGHLHKFDFASVTGVSSHTTYQCLDGVTGSHVISPETSQNHASNSPRTLNILFDNYNDGESTGCSGSNRCAFGYTLVTVAGPTVTVNYRRRTGPGTFVTAFTYSYDNDASDARR